MNVKQLQHLDAVIRHGSFQKAAEAIHISQPALSLSIKRLEESLQVTLLDRAKTGVRPTEFGQVLSRHMKNIEAELRTAREELAQLQGLTQGEVRIGISPYAATHALGNLLVGFTTDFPALNVRTDIGVYSVFQKQLRDASLDFFISEIRGEQPDTSVTHETIYHLPYIIVARAGHPLTRKSRVSVKDLVRYDWVYGTDWITKVDGWATAFADRDIEPPQASFYGGTPGFYLGLLEGSDLVAVAARPTVRPFIERGLLAVIEVRALRLSSPMALVRRGGSTLSPAAQLLYDTVKEYDFSR